MLQRHADGVVTVDADNWGRIERLLITLAREGLADNPSGVDDAVAAARHDHACQEAGMACDQLGIHYGDAQPIEFVDDPADFFAAPATFDALRAALRERDADGD